MGAESSTLQAVDSLGSTLADIERKLGIIEDVHLHHERTICHDNAVLVSGKMIQCRPGVNLIVGPILGLISQTSVNILVEADTDAELAIHFFLIDKLHTEARYLKQEVFAVSAGAPTVKKFTNLMAGTKYAAYIGGCDSQSTLLKYATFMTLPPTEDVNICPKIVFAHSGRIDRISPGEVNLWPELLLKIEQGGASTLGSMPAHGLRPGIDEYGAHNSRPEVQRAVDASFLPDDAISSVRVGGPVNMVVHIGDFLSVDPILRSRVLELLDVLLREDTSIDSWDHLLNETEATVREAYRRALNNPDMQRISRRCGNVFLAGIGEAGMLTTSLMGMGPPIPESTAADRAKQAAADKQLERENFIASIDKMGFKDAKAAREQLAEEDKEAAEAAARAKIPKKRGEMDPEEENDDDMAVPNVRGMVRRQREKVFEGVEARTKDQEEVRLLLLGAVVRMLRRVSWCYMRQLWDDNYEAVAAEEGMIEANQRAVLRTRKVLQVRRLLLSHLVATKAKIVREFGDEYKAATRVTARIETVQRDGDAEEQKLRDLLVETSRLTSMVKEVPNGACIELGNIILVLIETAWGWLSKDGLALSLYNRTVSVHPDIITRVDDVLLGSASCDGKEVNEEKSGGSEGGRVSGGRGYKPANTILCACSAPLLPTGQTLPLISPEEPQLFLPASAESGRLLRTFALWQQQIPERAVLLVAPCQTYSASGWAEPYIDPNDRKADAASGWNADRCKMRTLLVGPFDKRTKAVGSSRHDVNERAPPRTPLADFSAGFKVTYDVESGSSRRSYWEVTPYPLYIPRMLRKGTIMPGGPAGFHLVCETDNRQPVSVTVGPVVGRIMPRSASVLLESLHDAHVELLCIDQVTGVEYSCSRMLRGSRPHVFSFEKLVPGRAYDLCLTTPSSAESRSTNSKTVRAELSNVLIRGSFTTPPRGDWTPEDEARKLSAFATRLRAHGSGTAEIPADDADRAFAEDSRILGPEGVPVGPWMPQRALGIGGSTDKYSLSAASGVAGNAIVVKPLAPMRILCVGACKPSWLRLLSHMDAGEADESGLALDRSFLHGGLALTQAISNLTSRAYTPINIVVHCGLSVDLSVCLESVVSYLAQAEDLIYQHQFNQVAAFPAVQASDSMLALAEDSLRAAYRYHWGASTMKTMLAHNSHIFVSSPVLDVLTVFNAATLRQLGRDLSPFAIDKLIRITTQLEDEYQHSLWGTGPSGLAEPSRPAGTRYADRAHFHAGGSVCVLPLRIRVVTSQDSFGTSEDGLLPEEFFSTLSALLGHNESASSSRHVNAQENMVDTLVLVSPLPLVSLDFSLAEGTFLSGELRGLCYSPSETTRILDIVSAWLEEYSGRQAVIICGGVGVGCTTTVRADRIPEYVGMGGGGRAGGAGGRRADEGNSTGVQGAQGMEGMKIGFDESSVQGSAAADGRSASRGQDRPGSRVGSAAKKEDSGGGAAGSPGLQPAGGQGGNASGEFIPVSLPVLIRQICVGPLVGVYSEEQPADEGQLCSTRRLYTFKHDSFNVHPHCGLVVIPDNRQSTGGGSREEVGRVTLELCRQARVADLLHEGPEEGNTADAGAGGTAGADTKEVKRNQARTLHALSDPVVEVLWRKTRTHMLITRNSVKSKKKLPYNEDALVLSEAVNSALSVQAVQPLFLSIHKLLADGAFTYPFDGGAGVEETMLSVVHWLLNHMPRESRLLCPPPSSLVARLVWEKFALNTHTDKDSGSAGGAAASAAFDAGPTPSQVVCASMVADPAYLASFVRQAIEAQALLEHFALTDGYSDGWDN